MTRSKTKQLLAALTLSLLGAPAFAADIGVSVTVGQPGFYGRIDIGGAPPPAAFIYAQPVVIQPVRGTRYGPLYLRVPPGQERHWGKYCRRYEACGRQVYFVRDDWYQSTYAGRRDDRHDERGDRGRNGRHDDHDHDRGRGHGHDRD